MQIGLGHTGRDFCDGESLASPGRWKPEDRRYTETERWKKVVELAVSEIHRDFFFSSASC